MLSSADATMLLHFILLVLVSIDIRMTQDNRRSHEQTQAKIEALNQRLDQFLSSETDYLPF